MSQLQVLNEWQKHLLMKAWYLRKLNHLLASEVPYEEVYQSLLLPSSTFCTLSSGRHTDCKPKSNAGQVFLKCKVKFNLVFFYCVSTEITLNLLLLGGSRREIACSTVNCCLGFSIHSCNCTTNKQYSLAKKCSLVFFPSEVKCLWKKSHWGTFLSLYSEG